MHVCELHENRACICVYVYRVQHPDRRLLIKDLSHVLKKISIKRGAGLIGHDLKERERLSQEIDELLQAIITKYRTPQQERRLTEMEQGNATFNELVDRIQALDVGPMADTNVSTSSPTASIMDSPMFVALNSSMSAFDLSTMLTPTKRTHAYYSVSSSASPLSTPHHQVLSSPGSGVSTHSNTGDPAMCPRASIMQIGGKAARHSKKVDPIRNTGLTQAGTQHVRLTSPDCDLIHK